MNPSQLLEEAENCFKQGKIVEAAKHALKAKPHRDQYGYCASYIIHMALINRKSFYKMLRIDDPCADEDTLRKAYSKMVSVLLPDKNRSVAAPNALRIINRAWEVLSDRKMRMEYNQKIGCFGKISHSCQGESESGSNGSTESEDVNSYDKNWAEEEVEQSAVAKSEPANWDLEEVKPQVVKSEPADIENVKRRKMKTEVAELEGSDSKRSKA